MKKHPSSLFFIEFRHNLLNWYTNHQRILPWRETQTPYAVWVSEIMLQQTQVATVVDYFTAFMRKFPTIDTLANAHSNEVLVSWRGLGYYSRALNLHFAAKQVVNDYNGHFPSTSKEILKLKGVGQYTAAAIASICFKESVLAIDANLFRVLSRVFADDYDVSKSTAFSYFSQLAGPILDDSQAGFINQAFMDLGARICKPKNPICAECPLMKQCLAFKNNNQSLFPVKTKKTKVSDLDLHYHLIVHENQLLIQQRNTDLFWKNLHELPTFKPNLEVYTSEIVTHKLSHILMKIHFSTYKIVDKTQFLDLRKTYNLEVLDWEDFYKKTFPRPIEIYIKNYFVGH